MGAYITCMKCASVVCVGREGCMHTCVCVHACLHVFMHVCVHVYMHISSHYYVVAM